MFDSLIGGNNYLLWMIPGIVLTIFGNLRLRRKFKKYGKIPNGARITGKDTARQILDSEELQKVPVKSIKGRLTDHYDPGKNVVNLSQPIYGKSSIGAMAVAAHETGHAIQDKDGYFLMKLRGWIAPLATIGTNFGYILIVAGLIIGAANIARIGVLLFALTTIFALVTLPVEFNASKRAKKKLKELGITKQDEDKSVDDMLDAAAFTYIAAFATSAIQLLYWSLTVKGELAEDDDPTVSSTGVPATAATAATAAAASKAPVVGKVLKADNAADADTSTEEDQADAKNKTPKAVKAAKAVTPKKTESDGTSTEPTSSADSESSYEDRRASGESSDAKEKKPVAKTLTTAGKVAKKSASDD